ncbi:hypothetical protein [Pedobacter zeae]|uniref:Putative membrane protein n=1 Tax=Pedobacter zeae TaxID=1737356 RepID=A0A7W6K6H6_9SPHI|nr:hypothetical protein [Pedobacter zeae]MBB4106060.1 putative membrane protein [Pedobacter zeae]GGH19434.1 hypothetical protein GCM10007422_44260 [Pedobacter zeae]
MKINTTSGTLYFFAAFLILLSFLLLVFFFYLHINWNEFFNAAIIFLPIAAGMFIAAVLLFTGIYLVIKGINRGKEKTHIRYL